MTSPRLMRSGERFQTERAGIRTYHSFSFGDHYDPSNLGFGDLTAVNDERIDPSCGYDMHRHRDAEIVTWVIDGVLAHADTAGDAGTITRGDRKSTRLNSSHVAISYAVFCLKKKKKRIYQSSASSHLHLLI